MLFVGSDKVNQKCPFHVAWVSSAGAEEGILIWHYWLSSIKDLPCLTALSPRTLHAFHKLHRQHPLKIHNMITARRSDAYSAAETIFNIHMRNNFITSTCNVCWSRGDCYSDTPVWLSSYTLLEHICQECGRRAVWISGSYAPLEYNWVRRITAVRIHLQYQPKASQRWVLGNSCSKLGFGRRVWCTHSW